MSKTSNAANLTEFYLIVISLMLTGILLGNQTVTVISQHISIPRNHCVVIDAGHGGEDGGAVSVYGRTESAYNLEIALRLQEILQLLGVKTKMIRTEDVSVYTRGNTVHERKASDLIERVRLTNMEKNPILISIHQNYYEDGKYSGAQVFYNENSESKKLAQILQSQIIASINSGSRRKEKPGENIYLLKHVPTTAVLIECGFLSNPQESRLLEEKQYQLKIISVIGTTLAQYLYNLENDVV